MPLPYPLCVLLLSIGGLTEAGFAAHDGPHGPAHTKKLSKADLTGQKAVEHPIVIGQGKNRYRWNGHWAQIPATRTHLGSTHGGIVADRGDNIVLSRDEFANLATFGPDGTFVAGYSRKPAQGIHSIALVTQARPSALANDPKLAPIAEGHWSKDADQWELYEQTLWLADTPNQAVVQTDLSNKVLRTLPWPEASGKYTEKGQYKPTAVAVAPDGSIFVGDGYGQSWIHRYSPEGEYQLSFGGRGPEKHQLNTPHGLWLDWHSPKPTLLVADREKNRLVRFSLDGEYMGETAEGLLRRPCTVQFRGGVGVVAELAGRVTLITPDLQLVAHLGDNPNEAERANFNVPPSDWTAGAFCAPHSATIDSRGNIYVMDWNVAGRVTKLERMPE